MMFLSLIATVITLIITTFFLIDTSAKRFGEGRKFKTVPQLISQKPVGDEIPVDNEDFKVIRLKSNNHYIVVIKRNPFNEIKQKAKKWFDEQYPNSDICKLGISFVPDKKVTGVFTAIDAVVESCSMPKRPTPEELKAK